MACPIKSKKDSTQAIFNILEFNNIMFIYAIEDCSSQFDC